jgi:hypothetical protein
MNATGRIDVDLDGSMSGYVEIFAEEHQQLLVSQRKPAADSRRLGVRLLFHSLRQKKERLWRGLFRS